MRLLSTRNDEIREFLSEDDAPSYAILSHTWITNEEVSLQEWQTRNDSVSFWSRTGTSGSVSSRSGVAKIMGARQLAAESGLDWIWVDT